MLHGLGPGSLLTGCTPVVNLFRHAGVPIAYTRYAAEYEVLADAAHPAGYEVYSVDHVTLLERHTQGLRQVECHPFYSLRHGADAPAPYWTLRRDETRAATAPGHEAMLALVDPDGAPRPASAASLSLELTCTNRDLPAQLRIGAPEGDLFLPGGSDGTPIRLLRRPTRSHRISTNTGAHWRLISQLALDHQSLVGNGPDGLREALALYDPLRSDASQRQLNGIVGLDHERVARWMRHEHGNSLLFGTAVRVTIDPDAFAGTSLHLFAEVIDAFLGMSVQLNSFVELSIASTTGEELIQCKPRNGNLHLL